MYNFFKTKWFDIGLVISFVIIKGILMHLNKMSYVSLSLWMGFSALLLHQTEEYHWPGSFQKWINKKFYTTPRQNLYKNYDTSSFIVNVGVEWSTFILAALLAEKALWLGIAIMVFCLGNFFKHTIYYNLKAKTRYNPGMLTSIVFMLPVSVFFFWSVISDGTAGVWDYTVGIPLGIFFSMVSSVTLIEWLQEHMQRNKSVMVNHCL
ncbi:MAG: HXXEE domain-containing protein [Bacteroidota bacterium]|nr:HXXEE domain-containing protein [Bacteroidota bacterium]